MGGEDFNRHVSSLLHELARDSDHQPLLGATASLTSKSGLNQLPGQT